MKSQSPKKDRAFFKRTKEEINQGLSAKEALQYRIEKKQNQKMKEYFAKNETEMSIHKHKKRISKKERFILPRFG